MHEDLFFLAAGLVELSVSLINVRFNLSEFLNGPLGDVNKGFDFISGSQVEPSDRSLQFTMELTVVPKDKMEDVEDFFQPFLDERFLRRRVILHVD